MKRVPKNSVRWVWCCGTAVAWLLLLLPMVGSAQQHVMRTIDLTASPSAPYPVLNVRPALTMMPLVLDVSSTSAEIVWMTGAPADAQVRYGIHSLDHVAVPQKDGLIPVGDVHRVILRDLQPGLTYQYQVVSRRVVELRPYWPVMGHSVKSHVYSFTTFTEAHPTASFAFITDTHEDVPRVKALMNMIKRHPVDFVVDGGDIVNYAVSADQVRHKFLRPIAEALGGTQPLIYVRGNHENRGPYARSLGTLLHAQDGHYYYARDDGPLHLIVVDTGEDKPDSTNVYAGLNHMHYYRGHERSWFAAALAQPRTRAAPFTVVLGHQPSWGYAWNTEQREAWTNLANKAGVDLFIAGHLHVFKFIKSGEHGNDFPILVVGQDQVAHVVADDDTLTVTVRARTGKTIYKFTLHRRLR